MAESPADDDTLAHHLAHLAVTADDIGGLLNVRHEAGEIHPEALAKSEHLATSLRDVIHALRNHEHLAMSSDDVWKTLTTKHAQGRDGTVN